ncbi:MAG TPA: hypothetical protein VM536_18325 [Chloroflexia bacterium]|nr:hypothetical protein [Chloroflexia bacterium]
MTARRQQVAILLARLALVAGLTAAVAWAIQATRAGQGWRAGERLLAAGHYGEAATTLEDAINNAPPGGGPGYDSGRAHLALSYAYLARRDLRRAAAVLPTAPRDPALDAAVAVQRGVVAAATGDRLTAIRELGRAAAPSGDAWMRRAALWHLGEVRAPLDVTAATASFAALTSLPAAPGDPYTAAAWVRRAEGTVRDDPAAAAQYLIAARAALPADPRAGARPDLHLPDLGLDEGLPAAVLSDTIPRLEAALQGARTLRDAGGPALDLYWGQALVGAGAWPQAAALLGRVVAAAPTVADAHAYLGLARERLGDRTAAEASYRMAISLSHARVLPQHLLARLLIAEHRWAEARPLIDAVLAAQPDSVVAEIDRAGWAQAQGMDDEAEAALQTAEQQIQVHEALGTATAEERALNPPLLLAQFYFLAGPVRHDCSLARSAAERAVARRPGAAEYDALGWARHLCADVDGARKALEQAVALDRKLAAAHYHLGMVLLGWDDVAAEVHLTAAQDLDPGGIWARRALSALASP